MDKHLSLSMENVREQAYSQEELKKQIKAQYDLFSNAPYLEADKNRLMQIYKVLVLLLVHILLLVLPIKQSLLQLLILLRV